MVLSIDHDADVPLPDDHVAGLRPAHSLEVVDAGKNVPGCSVFVQKSSPSVGVVDKVRAVRFRRQTVPKFPGGLNNRFTFLGS
jgi:hypothetical protein